MPEQIKIDAVVVGAGVIGLAIAAELSQSVQVVVIERHDQCGQETSSRNSEVIHSGIYYPEASLKTSLCIEGRDRLYQLCQARDIAHSRIGKHLVIVNDVDEGYAERLWEHCRKIGMECQRKTGAQVTKEEPSLVVRESLFFPNSGIVDSHSLMVELRAEIERNGGIFCFNHRIERIERLSGEWLLTVRPNRGEVFSVLSCLVVNAAGLGAAELSNEALGVEDYEHRYCRGRYFQMVESSRSCFRHLIYPVPDKDGVGVHVTIDMGGGVRLGPDVDWVLGQKYDGIEKLYEVDWSRLRPVFAESVRKYCPGVEDEDLIPGFVGVRPKLFIKGEAYQDFLIENHHGWIHALGIESPGLTASLAIASYVKEKLL